MYLKRLFILTILFILMALFGFVMGCGAVGQRGATSTGDSIQSVEGEPTIIINSFDFLDTAVLGGTLPYLTFAKGGHVDETICFDPSEEFEYWQTKNPEIKKRFDAEKFKIDNAVLGWFSEEILAPEDRALADLAWEISVEKEAVKHVPFDKVRLSEEQTCVSETTHMLSSNAKVATVLFGASKITMKSPTPLDVDLVKKIKNAAKEKGFKFKAAKTYPKAKDENGKFKYKKGKPLFEAPDGTLVLRRDVPKPKDRPVVEFSLSLKEDAVFFAYGDMPSKFWTNPSPAPTPCSLNLIFGDLVPRVPDCWELNDAGFGVAQADSPEYVVVKMASDGEMTEATLRYGRTVKLQAGGRVVAWVTPQKIDEGAVLTVKGLVLNTSQEISMDLGSFDTLGQEKDAPEKNNKKRKKRK